MQLLTVSLRSSLIVMSLSICAGYAQQQDRTRQDDRTTADRTDSFRTSEDARLLASQLLDEEFSLSQGESCSISDLVLDTDGRRIAFALVATGGSDRLHAVPVSALGLRKTDSDEVRSDIDETASLDRWPTVSSDRPDAATEREFAERVERSARSDSQPTLGDNLVLVTDVMDMEVDTESDIELGTVENLAIASDSGRTPFVVIGTGGFLGIGETLRALPTSRLEFSQDDDDETELTVPMDEDEIAELPKFERDRIESSTYGGTSDAPSSGSTASSSADPEGTWILEIWEIHAVPTGVGPHIVAENARMPLSFPEDGIQRFVVEADVVAEDSSWSDERNPSDRGRSAPNDSKGARRAVYELSPADDQRSGSQRIDVKVTWHGAWSDKAMQQDSKSDRNRDSEAMAERSRSRTSDSYPKDEDDSCCRSFTIAVDPDGAIRSIDTDSEYTSSNHDHAIPLHRDRVQSHLELILGAGTHEGSLEVGEHYTCSAKPIRQGAFCLRYEGRTEMGSQVSPTSDGAEQGSTNDSRPNDGTQKERTDVDRKGLAGFSILDPERPTTHGEDQQDHQDDSADSRDRSDQHDGDAIDGDAIDGDRGMASDERRSDWSGMALYSLEDGMLEVLFARSQGDETERTILVRRTPTDESAMGDRSGSPTRDGADGRDSARNGGRRGDAQEADGTSRDGGRR